MRLLANAMGISMASVYNTFGSKRALFGRALELYVQFSTYRRLGRIEAASAPKRALIAFFDDVIENAAADPRGCFLVNSAVEVGPHDADLAAYAGARFREIEDMFRQAVLRSQQAGTTSPGRDAATIAPALFGVLLSLRVLARSRADGRLLRAVADPTLAMLN